MTDKNKKQKSRGKRAGNIIFLLCCMAVGAVTGYNIAKYADLNLDDLSAGTLVFRVIWVLLCIYIGFFLQIIIHETGHMVCGLMTGYRFSSFRIGSFMWMRQDGKICFKRYTLAGTGGQCLMCPPDFKDGKIPYILYNLGGALMNGIAAAAAFILWVFVVDNWYADCFLIVFAVSGLWLALVNGIPLKLDLLNNDGRNIVDIGKSRDEMEAFWMQMKVAELQTKGVRLRDMPSDWFEMPGEEAMKQSMTAVRGAFLANRLLDEHAFEETAELIDRLLDMDTAMIGIYRSLLAADRVYCELIGDQKEEVLDIWKDRQQIQVMKQMKNQLSVLRTQYTYALLHDRDEKKASIIRNKFEKMMKTYPYSGDGQSEKELLEIAAQTWERRKMRMETGGDV